MDDDIDNTNTFLVNEEITPKKVASDDCSSINDEELSSQTPSVPARKNDNPIPHFAKNTPITNNEINK